MRLIVGAVALLAVACAQTLYVDTPRLEQTISDGILEQLHWTVTRVDCPDQQPIEMGYVFECTADTTDGRQLTVTITQTYGAGVLNWRVTGESR